MNLRRFAGDVFGATKDKKRSALLGTVTSEFDPIGTIRAVGSQAHPLLGALDDVVGLGESLNTTNKSNDFKALGENIVGTIGSGLSTIGSLGGLLGSPAAAAAGPVGAITGLSTMIAKPAVEGMSDPNIRAADAEMYKKYMMR